MAWTSRVAAGALAALGVASFVVGHAYAQAQAPSFTLSWEAPEGCPSEAAVRSAVDQLLGEGPPPPVHMAARAVVERTADDRWLVHLTTVSDGTTGERVVDAASCPSLAKATALILALAIDPERVAAHAPAPSSSSSSSPSSPLDTTPSSSSSAAPAPVPAAPAAAASSSAPAPASLETNAGHPAAPASPPASAAPSRRVARAPAQSSPSPSPRSAGVRRRSSAVAVFVEAGGDVGTLPRTAFALGGGVGLLLGAFRLEGYGGYVFPQPAYAPQEPSIGTNIHLALGGLRGCFLPLRGELEAGGCAGLELGDLHGAGFGTLRSPYAAFTPSSAGGLWVAPTLQGRFAWRVAAQLALVLDLGLAVPLRRDTFVVDHLAGGPLHQPAAVVGRAAFGPEIRF